MSAAAVSTIFNILTESEFQANVAFCGAVVQTKDFGSGCIAHADTSEFWICYVVLLVMEIRKPSILFLREPGWAT